MMSNDNNAPITPEALRALAAHPRDYPEDTYALKAAADEIERLTATGWRPIETAPRDQTPILLYEDGTIVVGAFVEVWQHGSGWVAVYMKDGKFHMEVTIGDQGAWWVEPTHWMPLPEFPE